MMLVPKGTKRPKAPPEVGMYVDETYLVADPMVADSRRGVLQCIFPVPAELETPLRLRLDDLARGLARERAIGEFKGSDVNETNADLYYEVLKAAVETTRADAYRGLCPIVTLEGAEPHKEEKVTERRSIVIPFLQKLRAEWDDHLVTEFIRQLYWFQRILDYVISARRDRSVGVIFDEKYRYATKINEQLGISGVGTIAPEIPMLWRVGDVFSTAATEFLRLFSHKDANIEHIDIGKSANDRLLQVSDLYVHLSYASIRHQMGVKDDLVKLKHELLLAAVPGFDIPPDLANCLGVRGKELYCTAPDTFRACSLRGAG